MQPPALLLDIINSCRLLDRSFVEPEAGSDKIICESASQSWGVGMHRVNDMTLSKAAYEVDTLLCLAANYGLLFA